MLTTIIINNNLLLASFLLLLLFLLSELDVPQPVLLPLPLLSLSLSIHLTVLKQPMAKSIGIMMGLKKVNNASWTHRLFLCSSSLCYQI